MAILLQRGRDARGRHIISLPYWEEMTETIFRREEKCTGGGCMLTREWRQSKMHHDLQMSTHGKKVGVGRGRKSSKLQQV